MSTDNMDPPNTEQTAPVSTTTAAATAASDDGSLTTTTSPFTTLNELCYELSSLHDLATRGSWRSILDKVDRARKQTLLSKPHEHLTYLAYNSLALVKLRRFADAEAEIDSLDDDLDSPQYRYETYVQHYPNRHGSMVPFVLRWIHAEIPSKLGKQQETLDRLYILLDFVRTELNKKISNNLNVSIELWRHRENFVANSMICHHLGRKEFGVSLHLIRDMMKRNGEMNNPNPVSLSKLGYIQMQYGDLEGAKETFERIESIVEGKEDVEMKNMVSRNKALVYLVGKDYVSAVKEYGECIERDESDVIAINNKALCLMYLRELSGSIQVLEKSLETVPAVALNETLVVNLCSMYELAYVNHSDTKKTLSNWIARVAPDDFDSSCTRI